METENRNEETAEQLAARLRISIDVAREAIRDGMSIGVVEAAHRMRANMPRDAAAVSSPASFMESLREQGVIDGLWIGPPNNGEALAPGATRYFALRVGAPRADARPIHQGGPGWLRHEMPQVATLFDWLRTWVPADLVRQMFANLWAGRGYACDASTWRGLGRPPRGRWRITGEDDRGVLTVEPLEGL